jgi:hypothetical protein
MDNHPFTRDKAGMRRYTCSDCGAERPDYSIYERRGCLLCQRCLLNTADKVAYERWFVRED